MKFLLSFFTFMLVILSTSPAFGQTGTIAMDAEKDCQLGNSTACFEIGKILRTKSSRTEQETGYIVIAFGRGCELKHGPSCIKFRELKKKRTNTPRDPSMAFKVYARACELSQGMGCLRAANLLQSVRPPAEEQDKQVAAVQELYKRGCALNDAHSCQAVSNNKIVQDDSARSPQYADATFVASRDMPASLTARNSDAIIHQVPYPGPDAPTEDAMRMKTPTLDINVAVESFAQKMKREGYNLLGTSYVMVRPDNQRSSRFNVSLTASEDYVFFAACTQPCEKMSLAVWRIRGGESRILQSGPKTVEIRMSPKTSDLYSIVPESICPNSPNLCPSSANSGTQLVVYKKLRAVKSGS